VWPLSSLAQQVLTESHSVQVRATAYTAALGTFTGLPVSGGSVSVDSTSTNRRTATVAVSGNLWPASPLDLLSPLGSELLIEYGIVLPGQGVEWIPVIRGVLDKDERVLPVSSGDGSITISLTDRSLWVQEDRLLAPMQTTSGATVVNQIGSLVQSTLPTVAVTDLTGSAQVATVLDIQRDKWTDGIEMLATALGAEVAFDPVGNFLIRPTPTLTNAPVWMVAGAKGGVLVSIDEVQSRENVYNAVVASGQTSDGTAPVTATVYDTDPNSPTLWGGSFGKKPRFYSSPLLTTTAQCQTAGAALLARATGMCATMTLQAIANPALDAGDVIAVAVGNTVALHIIDTVTIPLKASDTQRITTRTNNLPAES
jgi:hypothetical protein